jgi:hypothetical protein
MRSGRPRCWARAAPEDAASVPAAEAAAMAPAVPVQRNWRRDMAEGGEQDVQRHDKPGAELRLIKSVMESSRLGCSRSIMLFRFR